MSGDIYHKWRESEASAVPMTEDGVKRSEQRWRGFNMGYKQAMKDVIILLMVQHEAAKDCHNYCQVAATPIQADQVHASDTSSERVNKTEKSEHEDWREWVGLTDEEIKRIGKLDLDSNYFGLWYDFAKAIEDKLKDKNHG